MPAPAQPHAADDPHDDHQPAGTTSGRSAFIDLQVRRHVSNEMIAEIATGVRAAAAKEGADLDQCFFQSGARADDHPELWQPFLEFVILGVGRMEIEMSEDGDALRYPQEEQAHMFACWLMAQIEAALERC